MIKKLSYRFLILFLITTMFVNTYTFTKSEASSAGISTAIQYFVDFAVSYLGYSANKQDRVSIANQLIQTYSAEKEKLYDFSKKLIFASWAKTLSFLGNKVGAFENDMKRYLTFVKSLLFNRDQYISNTSTATQNTSYFIINNTSKKVSFEYNLTGKEVYIPFYCIDSKLNKSQYIDIKDTFSTKFNSFYNEIYDLPLKFTLDQNHKILYNNRKCFKVFSNGISESFSDSSVNLKLTNIKFTMDNITYSVNEYFAYIKSIDAISKEAFQDYLSYFFRNSVVKADKRSLSNTLNSAPVIKTIVKDIDLTSQDYNVIVDKVLEKLPDLDNYVTDSSSNSQVLNYNGDGVINREIDSKKTLTGSDIVNLNVDKLLENTANIADDVKQNSSLIKQVYDSVVSSREAILKLGVDLASVNTSALSIASDLAAVRSATDVITSDTFSKSISDSVSTSVSQSIGKTISTTLDNKFGNKDNKRINLDPLKNLIIKEKFPFSLPFDLKDTITTMRSKQIIPNFDLKIKGYHMNVDFSMFDSLVKKARPFFLLMFCVFLVLATKQILS